MTPAEYKRAIEIIIEMAQDGCIILSTADEEIIKKFDAAMQ